MARRKFNWKLAVVLLLTLVVLGVTGVGLRIYQRTRQAEDALRAGTLAYEEERWSEAATSLGQYIGRNPEDIDILLKYADAQLHIRPWKPTADNQAISAYRAILRQDPSNQEAIEPLIQLYLEKRLAVEAELVAARYTKVNPNAPPEIQRWLVIAQASQGKMKEAVQGLDQIIQTHPDFVAAYETMGQLAQQRPDEVDQPASYWFDRVVELNPQLPAALLARSAHHYRQYKQTRSQDDLGQSTKDLQEAEAMDPNQTADKLRLAVLWLEMQDPKRAEEYLDSVAEGERDNAQLWEIWMRLAIESKSGEKMAHIAEKGLAALKEDADEFLVYATELFIRAGRPSPARECIDRLAVDDRFATIVPFLKGWLLQTEQEYRSAVVQYRRALESGYDTPRLRLLMSESLQHAGDNYASIAELQNAVSKYPRSYESRIRLAEMLAQDRRWDEARMHAREASFLNPNSLAAILLELRMGILLLSDTEGVSENAWQDIESRLDALERENEIAQQVQALRLLLSMKKQDYRAAEGLLGMEPESGTPSHRQWLHTQANLLAAKESYAEAEELLQKGILLYPEDFQIARILALVYIGQGKVEEGVQVLEGALDVVSSDEAKKQIADVVKIYDQIGEQDKATDRLMQLKQNSPDDVQVLRLILDRYNLTENTASAQEMIDKIRNIEGEEGLQWRFEQARLWALTGTLNERYEEIAQLLEGILRANPDDQSSRMLLARVQEIAGNLQLAIGSYQEALDRNPDSIGVIESLVRVLKKTGDIMGAAAVYDRKIEEDGDVDLLRSRARFWVRANETERAEADYRRILELDPNNVALRNEKAEFHRLTGNLAGAIRELEVGYSLSSKDTVAAVALADTYIIAQSPDKAVSLLKEHISTATEDDSIFLARILLARALLLNEQKGEGEQLFEELDKIRPHDMALLGTYLQTLCQSEDRLKAEAVADRLLATGAELSTLVSISSRLFQQGAANTRKIAGHILEQGVAEHPDSQSLSAALILLAQIANAEGQSSQAADYYRRVIATAPRGENREEAVAVATNNLAWFLGVEQGKLEDAYAMTLSSINEFPGYFDLKDTHGTICWRLGKLDEAAPILEECVNNEEYAKTKAGTGSRFRLGQVYHQMGRKAEAKALLEESKTRHEDIGGLSTEDLDELNRLLLDMRAQ